MQIGSHGSKESLTILVKRGISLLSDGNKTDICEALWRLRRSRRGGGDGQREVTEWEEEDGERDRGGLWGSGQEKEEERGGCLIYSFAINQNADLTMMLTLSPLLGIDEEPM